MDPVTLAHPGRMRDVLFLMKPFRNIINPLFEFFGLVAFASLAVAAEPEVMLPEKHFALLEAYCLDCHDSDTRKGKVDLEALSFQVTSIEQAELWQKVLKAMNAGEMPPENKRQPKNVEKADFLDDLARAMVLARKKLSDSGGKITMRRLNRREYQTPSRPSPA